MTEFLPNWVSPPGDTLKEMMAERKKTHKDLAILLGVHTACKVSACNMDDQLLKILDGTLPITDQMAEALEQWGTSKEFWQNREAQYRAGLHRNYHRLKKENEKMLEYLEGYDQLADYQEWCNRNK